MKPDLYLSFVGEAEPAGVIASGPPPTVGNSSPQLTEAELIFNAFEVLSTSSQSAWAKFEDLQQAAQLEPALFGSVMSRCLQRGLISHVCGYARPLHHSLCLCTRELPTVTGAHGTDIFRLVQHLGHHFSDGRMIPSQDARWVPLVVVRHFAEHHLKIPFEFQFDAWLSHLSAIAYVEHDRERARATTSVDEAQVATQIINAYVSPARVGD